MLMSILKSNQPLKTTGNNLVGLWRPSFVKVDQRLFVFGGGGNVTNDLHVLHLTDMRWETIQNIKGTSPCKRYGHTATLWNNCILVFGGCNEFQEYCNDVHIFDLDKFTWFQPKTTGAIPARYLHSAVAHDDKLFIYGGFAKNSDCTFVLDELNVLDLKSMNWSKHGTVPPRYNHSATIIGNKMYIYAGKDEQGCTVSDLFSIHLECPPYVPHLVLNGSHSNSTNQMVLLKSQHFCEAVCGKLLVFGRYLADGQSTPSDATYGLWMLNLDRLEWERQECNANFQVGGWNYFTVLSENMQSCETGETGVKVNNLFFLGNTDPFRPQGYDHFRDALIINGESLGLYDIPALACMNEFGHLLNSPQLSDFVIVPAGGQAFHVHQVILMTRWPHFRNIYKSGMVEVQQGRMEMPEPPEVVQAFLTYIYSDNLDPNTSCRIVCEVLVLANMYLLHRLKKICCKRLYQQHLTVEHCGLIFEKAILSEENGLRLLVLDFIFKNYGAVLKSNVLLEMPLMIRQEFLQAVPDEAVLEVTRSRFSHVSPSKTALSSVAAAMTSHTGNISITPLNHPYAINYSLRSNTFSRTNSPPVVSRMRHNRTNVVVSTSILSSNTTPTSGMSVGV
ncbi:hypothetical protein CLU79DRAFT_731626 [Phycomyces nitens]|nr:hypothetical protein CLU79DRAFT_731626 [Phycomyces nitens]